MKLQLHISIPETQLPVISVLKERIFSLQIFLSFSTCQILLHKIISFFTAIRIVLGNTIKCCEPNYVNHFDYFLNRLLPFVCSLFLFKFKLCKWKIYPTTTYQSITTRLVSSALSFNYFLLLFNYESRVIHHIPLLK